MKEVSTLRLFYDNFVRPAYAKLSESATDILFKEQAVMLNHRIGYSKEIIVCFLDVRRSKLSNSVSADLQDKAESQGVEFYAQIVKHLELEVIIIHFQHPGWLVEKIDKVIETYYQRIRSGNFLSEFSAMGAGYIFSPSWHRITREHPIKIPLLKPIVYILEEDTKLLKTIESMLFRSGFLAVDHTRVFLPDEGYSTEFSFIPTKDSIVESVSKAYEKALSIDLRNIS